MRVPYSRPVLPFFLPLSLPGHAFNQVGYHTGERWATATVPVPQELQCIIFTPDTPMNTKEARAMLKPKVG